MSTLHTRDRPGWLGFPRTVWRLGLTSLFTDTASEAVYPLLPVFLSRVLGATAFSLGVIEGLAEGANSLLKVASGYLSDRWQRRHPIVVAGYGLSSAIRPFIAAVGSWPQLLAIRLTDRVGKGVRGAPRDAILAAWSEPGTRGRIFGFHRAMDHVGAIAGPVLASLFLLAFPGRYRLLFALTAIPGAVAVWLLLGVRERPADDAEPAAEAGGAKRAAEHRALSASPGPGVTWSDLSPPFRSYLGVLLLFTLGNSSDAFLLLRFTDVGFAPALVPLIWAALHVVKASFSVLGGVLSDKLGRQPVIVAGWLVYGGVYAGFAATESVAVLVALFLVYGLYYGLTEGTEKALVADLVPAASRGTAFGLYNAVLGVGAMGASLVFGALWTWVSPAAAFALGAALALVASMLLYAVVPRGSGMRNEE